MNAETSKREQWVDAVKIFACVLVVLGHFFQSMQLSSIIQQTFLLKWFNQAIYHFHVPLFFICSGYLYQKYSIVRTFKAWKSNFLKKLVSLGIPYFVFTFVTWLLKTVFSDSVNHAANGLFSSLFVSPISPYWYLYALFFLFIITPTADSKKTAICYAVAAILMKAVTSFSFNTNIYAVNTILQNEVWFVFGMCIYIFDLPSRLSLKKKNTKIAGVSTGLLFLALSLVLCKYSITYGLVDFVMGVIGCTATILLFSGTCSHNAVAAFIKRCSRFTFPVYLMHTLFAASFRAVLLKLGVTSAAVHIFAGLTISFVGPVIAVMIMEKIKYLDFVLYPGKYLVVDKK